MPPSWPMIGDGRRGLTTPRGCGAATPSVAPLYTTVGAALGFPRVAVPPRVPTFHRRHDPGPARPTGPARRVDRGARPGGRHDGPRRRSGERDSRLGAGTRVRRAVVLRGRARHVAGVLVVV